MRLFPIAAAGLLIAPVLMAVTPPVPRPAPDFIISFPGAEQKALGGYKGKVVCVEFLFTTCPHCQHASQIFTKLYNEYGPQGFLPIGVAFNDMPNMLVPDFIKNQNLSHPVGYADRDKVLDFLGISVMERFVVPQIVWIDKKGIIRSQTPPLGEQKLLEEPYWREMIETLLKEPGPPTKKTATQHTTAKAKKGS
jgi:thiol-disulfide isomerase/thioredoxin